MASLLEWPEMRSTVVDDADVEGFFSELSLETRVIGVLIRGAAITVSDLPTLREARDLLLSGRATGVQIRYVHLGAEWSDTIMRTGAGLRMVRVRK